MPFSGTCRWTDPAVSASAAIVMGCLVLLLAGRVAAQGCATCVPVDDLSGAPYLGSYPMGLYAGSNAPPAAHAVLAQNAASQIVPRDALGNPSSDGWIGVIAIGMSNCNQEFAAFERHADPDPSRNARLVFADGAVGGQSADLIVNRLASYWTTVDQRLAAAGLTAGQVQVVWVKEADALNLSGTFPAAAESLTTHLRGIVRHLKDRFPRLALCYLSSRIYGGYGSGGEPRAYETAFAVRALLQEQIAGSALLNADPMAGPVESAVLLWGPYLWARGTTPRASDGLTWQVADLESDFTHPSPSGELKVASLLTAFLHTDATASPWFLATSSMALRTVDPIGDTYVSDAQPAQNFGAVTVLQWANAGLRSYVLFDLAAVTDSVARAKLSFRNLATDQTAPLEVVVVTNTAWSELALTAANAPPFDGAVLGTIPQASRGTALSVDVTAAVRAAIAGAPGAARIAFGLRPRGVGTAASSVTSRETTDPPRLVLSTVTTATDARGPRSGDGLLALEASSQPFGPSSRLFVRARRECAGADVALFDARGARLRTLYQGRLAAGRTGMGWDLCDRNGHPVPSGVYWVRATAAGALPAVRKLVVARSGR